LPWAFLTQDISIIILKRRGIKHQASFVRVIIFTIKN